MNTIVAILNCFFSLFATIKSNRYSKNLTFYKVTDLLKIRTYRIVLKESMLSKA